MNSTGKWVLGLGVVVLGGWLLFRKKTPAIPEDVTLIIIPGVPYYGIPDGYAGITVQSPGHRRG